VHGPGDEEDKMKKKKDTASENASGWGSEPGGGITPQEVQQKEFRVARFGAGYRMREVDEFLDQVTDAMSALAAENERLLRGSAIGSMRSNPPSPLSAPAPADDAGRAAVEAFLRRERGFLQDLGALVQTHAEELRSMVRDVRRDIAGSAAAESPAKGSSAEPAPVIEPEPESEPAPIEAAGEPEETPPDPEPTGTTEQAMDVGEDELEDEPDGSAGPSTATTGVIAEEPIRLDEPEPARSGRSDDEEEGSLRELFWGEE
jgi:DivIVA domain-containing protein